MTSAAEYYIPEGWIEDVATSPDSLYLILAMFLVELDKAFPVSDDDSAID